MSELLKNIIRFILFILWLPFSLSRASITFVGFFFGLCLDYFTKTPGLHAAACTLIAYVRPFVISVLISQEGADKNYVAPSIVSMGWAPYATYVIVLTVLHHAYLVLLEWLNFGSLMYFIGKVIASSAVSLLLILLTEMLFFR